MRYRQDQDTKNNSDYTHPNSGNFQFMPPFYNTKIGYYKISIGFSQSKNGLRRPISYLVFRSQKASTSATTVKVVQIRKAGL
jgi:hypothetical protein